MQAVATRDIGNPPMLVVAFSVIGIVFWRLTEIPRANPVVLALRIKHPGPKQQDGGFFPLSLWLQDRLAQVFLDGA